MMKKILLCFLLVINVICLAGCSLSDRAIHFSSESGFYSDEFELELKAPNGYEIYYTLDGSVPDQNSYHYEKAIHIYDATENPNVYSMITDISALDILGGQEVYTPDYPVDKCMVVSAIAYDKKGNSIPVVTKSYFVGDRLKDKYNGIRTISLVTDPDNLFGYENGIYVTGKTFDDYINGERDPIIELNTGWYPTNYKQTGIEWERPAVVTMFDCEGCEVWSQNIGIRIQGEYTRANHQKGFKLYARKEYSGSNKMNYDVFSSGYMAHKLMLFGAGQDNEVKIVDYLVSSLSKDYQFATLDMLPCVVFLDGEYWGFYYIAERFDKHYVEHHYGVDDDNVIIVNSGELDEGSEDDMALYNELVDFVMNEDLSIPENYDRLCQLVDMDSLLDYYATELYIGRRGDWPDDNFALWRCRNTGNGQYEDGRWRWMLFDVNSPAMVFHDDTAYVNAIMYSEFFRKLYFCDEFKINLATRMMDISNDQFRPENVNAFLDEWITQHKQYVSENFYRFYSMSDYRFDVRIGDIRYYFNENYEIFRSKLAEVTYVAGEPLSPDSSLLILHRIGNGAVKVNNIFPNFEDDKWSGYYLSALPIDLYAVEEGKSHFVGWKVNGEIINDTHLNITLGETQVDIEAIFE